MKKTAAVVIISSMSMALVACGPSPEFEKNCKNAGGEVKRESEVSSIFGMAPIAFEVVNPPRPPAPAPKPAIKIPKVTTPVQKAPKVNSPTLVPKAPPVNSDTNIQMPAAAGSGKGKSKKSSDDDWVCVKNGEVIFEED